jgi:hypothetical protein
LDDPTTLVAEVQTFSTSGCGVCFIFTNVCYPYLPVCATAIMLAIYINRAQTNLMRSFTMFEDKYHYMTIAATNEADVSFIVKRIDPNNKIRFEKNVIKKRVEIKKTIG